MGPSAAWFYKDQPSSAPKQQQQTARCIRCDLKVRLTQHILALIRSVSTANQL